MGISRDITKLIDTTKVYNPALAFEICRGDTVNFSFTFNADISSATLARIFAKPLKHNGVNHNDNPLFAAEITLDNPTGINHTIASAETASDAGEYLLSIVLLDASENTVTATTIPFALFEQGYSGIYTPSADFRDELLTTCYNAISAAENTAYYASEVYNTYDSILSTQGSIDAKAEEVSRDALQVSSNTTTVLEAAAKAEQAALNAKAISDPDGLLNTLNTEVKDIALNKLSDGWLNFKPKAYAGKGDSTILSTANLSRSAVFKTDFDFKKNTANGFITNFIQLGVFNKENSGAWLGYYGDTLFYYAAKDGVRTAYKVYEYPEFSQYLNDAINAICFTLNTDADSILSGDVYINGHKLTGRVVNTFALSPFNNSYTINERGATKEINYKDIAIFNYDIATATDKYNLTDYLNGKAIVAGKNYFDIKEAAADRQWQVGGYLATGDFKEENGVYTLTKGIITGDEASSSAYVKFKLKETIKAGSEVEVYIKKTNESILPYLIRFTPKVLEINNETDRLILNVAKDWNGNEYRQTLTTTKDHNGVFIQIGSSTPNISFTDFQIKVNGAIVNLDNAITDERITDITHNNDAVIFGQVNAIETKKSVESLRFRGRAYAQSTSPLQLTPNCSRCFKLKMTNEQWLNFTGGYSIYSDGAGATNGIGFAMQKYFGDGSAVHFRCSYYDKEGVYQDINVSSGTVLKDKIFDGNYHDIAFILSSDYLNTTFKVYVDGCEVVTEKRLLIETSNATSNLNVGYTNAKFTGEVSNIYAFNFDISKTDAVYTLADYNNNKPIPADLLKGSQKLLDKNYDKWEIYNSSSFSIAKDVYADTLTFTCIAANNYITISDGFKSGVKAGDYITVEWDSIDLPADVYILDKSVYTNATNVSVFNGQTLRAEENSSYIYFRLAFHSNLNVGDVVTVRGLRITVNGAQLALENFTLNKKILDYSGNNNDFTITDTSGNNSLGSVIGSNDSKVSRLIQHITTTASEQA